MQYIKIISVNNYVDQCQHYAINLTLDHKKLLFDHYIYERIKESWKWKKLSHIILRVLIGPRGEITTCNIFSIETCIVAMVTACYHAATA